MNALVLVAEANSGGQVEQIARAFGVDWPHLIAQIISLINAGKFDEIVEKDDALRIYCQRYIRLKDNSRTYYFMKMLQVMIKYSFEPEKTELIARKYFNHLTDTKRAGKSLEELEVIPFDVLWLTILEKLREA